MMDKDVVYLWAACARCTCGRLPAPHPAEMRRLGMSDSDVTDCGECGRTVMDFLTDGEIEAFSAEIEDASALPIGPFQDTMEGSAGPIASSVRRRLHIVPQ